MIARFHWVFFLVVTHEVLLITNAQTDLGALPLPPEDSAMLQDNQLAQADPTVAGMDPTLQAIDGDMQSGAMGGMSGAPGGFAAGSGMAGLSTNQMAAGSSAGYMSEPGMAGPTEGLGMPNDGSGAMTTNAVNQKQMFCYAHGPLLPEYMLPKPKQEAPMLDAGEISCEEVVGYIMGLNRFYDRKCSRMGSTCPFKYQYAVSWFGKVGHMIMAKCNITRR